MHNVEELHDGCAIVGDGLSAVLIHHEQVAAIRPQRPSYCMLHSEAGVDIG
jgi:hypothetical protein